MFRVLAFLLLALAWGPGPQAQESTAQFSFVALGDMPYDAPGDDRKFERLIAAINRQRPAFSLHVGDFKSGASACDDATFLKMLDWFNDFEQPLIYTMGDNEWTDCHRPRAGGFDPLERLARLRQIFFKTPGVSLGRARIALSSQGGNGGPFDPYVENARFEKSGVVFATVHVVGSNNGFTPANRAAANEFFERDAANAAWIDAAFRRAADIGAAAVVLAWQADVMNPVQRLFGLPDASAYRATIAAVARNARAFGKPVLIVHGDTHVFEVMPFLDVTRKPVGGVLRLQVMGEAYVHAVRVHVDPATAAVFSFEPLIVPGNLPIP
jgi:hypothetical protein